MNKKIICIGIVSMFLLTSFTIFSAVAIKTTIINEDINKEENICETIDDKTVIIRDDDGTMEERIPLYGYWHSVIKYLDIPNEVKLQRIESCKLHIYGKSSGGPSWDNEHYIVVNDIGAEIYFIRIEFDAEDEFKKDEYSWATFEIPVKYLKPGLNKFFISDTSTKGIDDLDIGIDTDNDFDRSEFNVDDWEGPDPAEECNGELMIYLELSLIEGESRSSKYINLLERIYTGFPLLSQLLLKFQ